MKASEVRRFEQRLYELDITVPVPFDPWDFCAHVAEKRGRPIHILPMDVSEAAAPCGLWLETEKADYFAVDPSAPRFLQGHILLHELSHLLCNHRGRLQLDASLLTFDFIDPVLVKRVLGRATGYPTEDEREAEGLASVFHHLAAQRSPVPRLRDPADRKAAALNRVSATFSADRRWTR